MDRNPRCVFIADNPFHAAFVIDWLDQHGIHAEMPAQRSPGELEGELFGLRSVEVWVADPEQAEKAVTLLADRELARLAKKTTDELSEEHIPAVCEKCGGVSTFRPQSRGSCENCQHCGAFVDVGEEEEAPATRQSDKSPSSEGIQRPTHLRGGSD